MCIVQGCTARQAVHRHARRLCRRTLRTVYGEAASRVVHSVRLPFYLIVRYVPGANS